MKKSLFAIAAIAVILAGCSKVVDNQTPEESSPVSPRTEVTLKASVQDDSETKVTNDNIGAYAWQAEDKITVFNTSNVGYEFSTIAGGIAVDFSSSSFDGTLGTVAMYPASSNHTASLY